MTLFGRVGWWGDKDSADKLTPHLERAGFTVGPMDLATAPRTATVLFFLSAEPRDLAELTSRVQSALDEAVNAVVVSPPSEAAVANERMAECRRALADVGIMATNGMPVRGAEVRDSAFDADDVLRCLVPHVSAVAKENEELKIDVTGPALGLLRRSFHDFTELRIARLDGGLANEGVFRVTGKKNGATTTPYVAKIATRENILKEAAGFERIARDYIPFANRPNFLSERSHVMARHGILIGQLAERANTLNVAVRRDGAASALHELFASVLHRWWSNSFHSPTPITDAPLLTTSSVQRWLIDDEHPKMAERRAHLDEARARAVALGLFATPQAKVRARLGAPQTRLRLGSIHGDLNCGNVLVRGDTPILIDFSHAADTGPLLCDPAWLEVNLAFACRWGDAEDAWASVVGELYRLAWLRSIPPLHFGEELDDKLHHLCTAIRSIRRHARTASVEADDYPRVVGAALVRFASMPHTDDWMRERAARAYAAASQIAENL